MEPLILDAIIVNKHADSFIYIPVYIMYILMQRDISPTDRFYTSISLRPMVVI